MHLQLEGDGVRQKVSEENRGPQVQNDGLVELLLGAVGHHSVWKRNHVDLQHLCAVFMMKAVLLHTLSMLLNHLIIRENIGALVLIRAFS